MERRVRPMESQAIRTQQRGTTLQGINIGNKQMKKIIIAAGIMLLSIIVIITITVIYITKAELLTAGMKYGIIIDPRVSYTRHIVYQWPAEKKRSTGVVTQKHLCTDAGIGIFQYKEHPKEAIESLLPCLNVTKNIIPKEQHNETQIHFIASTGLRLLYAWDNATVIKILSAIKVLFKTLPFSQGRVQILSKKEEAIYGWITVNYLKGELLKIDGLQQHRRSSGTTGTLALVGGATHITYVPKKIPKQIRGLTKYTLFGHRYRIYIHSFDCFGWAEAELRLMVILYQAFGRFYYVRRALRLPISFTVTQYKDALESFCKNTWDQVSRTQVSWSLGCMLSITNKIPRHIQGIKTTISQTTFRVLFFSFLLIGMVCVTFIFKVICS